MKALLAIALLLAACGKNPADPRAACADAANKGVDAMVRRATDRLTQSPMPDNVRATMLERTTKLGELAPKLKAVFTNRCVDDKWSRDVIDCYAKSSSVDEMRTCRGKLPQAAAQGLMRDEMDLMAGAMSPPSMAAIGPKGAADPAKVEEANKLAADMRAKGAELNAALEKVAAAKDDAERTAAREQVNALRLELDTIRSQLQVVQGEATTPFAPPTPRPPSAEQLEIEKQIGEVVKEIENAKNDAERTKARAKLESLQAQLQKAKKAPVGSAGSATP